MKLKHEKLISSFASTATCAPPAREEEEEEVEDAPAPGSKWPTFGNFWRLLAQRAADKEEQHSGEVFEEGDDRPSTVAEEEEQAGKEAMKEVEAAPAQAVEEEEEGPGGDPDCRQFVFPQGLAPLAIRKDEASPGMAAQQKEPLTGKAV